jgi:hypothetical protein
VQQLCCVTGPRGCAQCAVKLSCLWVIMVWSHVPVSTLWYVFGPDLTSMTLEQRHSAWGPRNTLPVLSVCTASVYTYSQLHQ